MIFLAFIVPVASYCLVVALINRRRHPILVPGPWDFAGVLFAASGFLVFGGPAILTGLYEQWRLSWLLGQTRYLQGFGENWYFWISLWVVYFAVITGGAAFVLWRRRGLTSIYNVELDVFEEVLIQVLDRLGLEWGRNGPCRFFMRSRELQVEGGRGVMDPILVPQSSPIAAASLLPDHAQAHPQRTGVTTQHPPPSRHPWTELDLEPFPTMRHVTLHWLRADEAVRLEVETELARALGQVRTRHNPVGVWFLCLAVALFFLVFFLLLVLVAMRIFHLPH